MTILLPRRLPGATALCLLLAGCSGRGGVEVAHPVHASAAQRIELPGVAADTAPAVSASLAPGSRLQPATPEEIHLPDGTVGVKVAQQYYHTIVACRLKDGSFSTQCPPSPAPLPEPRP